MKIEFPMVWLQVSIMYYSDLTTVLVLTSASAVKTIFRIHDALEEDSRTTLLWEVHQTHGLYQTLMFLILSHNFGVHLDTHVMYNALVSGCMLRVDVGETTARMRAMDERKRIGNARKRRQHEVRIVHDED